MAHFRWRLVYHGRPSSMGLRRGLGKLVISTELYGVLIEPQMIGRHFQKNGVFVSPHFGETRWQLGLEEVRRSCSSLT